MRAMFDERAASARRALAVCILVCIPGATLSCIPGLDVDGDPRADGGQGGAAGAGGDAGEGGAAGTGGTVDPCEGVRCDDGNACTDDSCDPAIGCIHVPLCDANATCVAAACVCKPGYVGDGYECSATPPGCGDGACTGSEDFAQCPADCDHDLIVIVEEVIAGVLSSSLDTYLSDLEAEGLRGRVEPWTPGTVDELKTLIFAQVDKYGAEGAFLIGNMPAAWYEQTAFETHEEFPIDLFLQDRRAVWGDYDADGIYDSHSRLELDIYVSRLQTLPHAEECVSSASFPTCPLAFEPGGAFYASEACLDQCPSRLTTQSWHPSHPDVECCGTFFFKRYFERLHEYRTQGSLVHESAFVFVDDDWSTWAEAFCLDSIYSTVHIVNDIQETTKEKYIDTLTGQGAEFVYHWTHATPDSLLVYVDDVAHQIHRTQIGWSPWMSPTLTYNLETSFVNLFSCEAARFTVPNMGMAMTLQTDFGLAIIGSTKRGGIWDPDVFHTSLSYGEPWGEAYRVWYNDRGYADDEWHLGMVLLGDPLLTLTGDLTGIVELARPQGEPPADLDALRQTIIDTPPVEDLDTFEQYRESNPQFFE